MLAPAPSCPELRLHHRPDARPHCAGGSWSPRWPRAPCSCRRRRAPAQQAADPPDPVGAPGRYTILRGDDLFISRQGNGAASVSWLEANGALGVAAQSPFAAAGALPREVLFPQARGRFRDPLSDRVLASTADPGRRWPAVRAGRPDSACRARLERRRGAGRPASRPSASPCPNPEANAPSALATGDLDNLADASRQPPRRGGDRLQGRRRRPRGARRGLQRHARSGDRDRRRAMRFSGRRRSRRHRLARGRYRRLRRRRPQRDRDRLAARQAVRRGAGHRAAPDASCATRAIPAPTVDRARASP